MHWLIAFLRVLFPSPQTVRRTARVLKWMDGVEALLSGPDNLPDLQTREGCLKLESGIALVEDWITFLINARAAELLGHRHIYEEHAWCVWVPSAPRNWASLMQRYKRLWSSFARIKRMVHRRANRMHRALKENPLRLATSAQSVSPAFAVEANHRCVASLSAQRWGRWLRTLCADGGGSHARGPPPIHFPIPDLRASVA